MRRTSSRSADGWWLLLITVLGWVLVSYGGHHIFGEQQQQCCIGAHLIRCSKLPNHKSGHGYIEFGAVGHSEGDSYISEGHDIERRQLQTSKHLMCFLTVYWGHEIQVKQHSSACGFMQSTLRLPEVALCQAHMACNNTLCATACGSSP